MARKNRYKEEQLMPKILVIDDKRDNLVALEALLEHLISNCEVITAQSGKEGIEKTRKELPDTILLDVRMPIMSGYEVCQILKSDERTKYIPVIMITAIETDTRSRIKGLEIGGDAYISKPIDEQELAAQVKVMLRLKRSRYKLQTEKENLKKNDLERTKALRESEEKLRLLFNGTHDLITLTDADARIHWANPAWENVFGSHPEKRVNLFPLIHPEDFEKVSTAWKDMVTGSGEIKNLEYRFKTPGGEYKTFESTVHEAVVGGENLFYVIAHDITERKRLEEQLRQVHKMEAIGTLAGGIAHDFNNILGIIVGYTELTLEDVPEDSIQHRNLQQVLTAADRAGNLVKQILAFSRNSEREKSQIYINPIAEETLKMLRAALPTTIEIRSNIQEKTGAIMASPSQIRQVIINLCTNAGHAMKKRGGILEVILKEIDLDGDVVNGKELEPGTYLQLTVKDTGHGVNPAVMERIFEPYFTTKKPGEGAGMGLSVVHGIIKSHGGDITVHSEQGKGTTFHVYLPVMGNEKGENNRSEPVPGGTEHILFVDDEKELAEMGEQMLKKMGYTVTVKTNSVDVLEAFRKNPRTYDLVITDQTMPGMTGAQLTQELISLRHDIPVILCTGFSEVVNKENFRALGIRAFVMKPIIKNDIARVIRDMLVKNPNPTINQAQAV